MQLPRWTDKFKPTLHWKWVPALPALIFDSGSDSEDEAEIDWETDEDVSDDAADTSNQERTPPDEYEYVPSVLLYHIVGGRCQTMFS